ncbi:hypothetical protein XENOCAPTIV_002724 [Xenoophorus captivus]|uniref:Uncharacterized protein n=1 Tax=Xenoophorus captivus TaxID=1517983 RepID=A0ABV0S593_9TELE
MINLPLSFLATWWRCSAALLYRKFGGKWSSELLCLARHRHAPPRARFYTVNEAARSMSGDETCEETDWMSFEFSLRWTPMSFRRSSRLKSILKTPVLDKDVEQPRRRSLRGRSRLKETDAIKSDNCDIINLINRNRDSDHTAKLGEAVGILDFGLDQSDDEDGSESSSSSSIVSGPSTLCQDNKEELCHNLCSACQELYKKAKSLKTPILSKLLDNG